ncbi:unnamed protein product [Sphenostylis stenocarpa]|uniref:Uncharacterized protein n=1 Tax=Sphenostylis stenocarpa TaxID=92480 RepID=A0AA86W5D7_9FABA|nr:unnamed protein product [Sphenostylis stenocarpa]
MTIANAAFLTRAKDLTYLHIKGHQGHGEASVGRFAAPFYWASLPKGIPVPHSGPSLASNGCGPVPNDKASTSGNDV